MVENIRVYFISDPSRELHRVLKYLGEGTNIIYSNCICSLSYNNEYGNLNQFDTVIYNDDSSILIMLKCDNRVHKDDIINWFKRKGKKIVDVVFDCVDSCETEDNIQRVCIPKNIEILESFLFDSSKKGEDSCVYYPKMDCNIQLSYLSNNGQQNTLSINTPLDIIKLGDKNIFISNYSNNVVCNGMQTQVSEKDILAAIMRSGMSCEKKISNIPSSNVKRMKPRSKD